MRRNFVKAWKFPKAPEGWQNAGSALAQIQHKHRDVTGNTSAECRQECRLAG